MSPERVDSNESSLLKKATIHVDVPEIKKIKSFTFKRIEKLEVVTLILVIVMIFINLT